MKHKRECEGVRMEDVRPMYSFPFSKKKQKKKKLKNKNAKRKSFADEEKGSKEQKRRREGLADRRGSSPRRVGFVGVLVGR